MTPAADFCKGRPGPHPRHGPGWSGRRKNSRRGGPYDGPRPPREIVRLRHPFFKSNGGAHMTFQPAGDAEGADYGLHLHGPLANGGSGGDPYCHGQNLAHLRETSSHRSARDEQPERQVTASRPAPVTSNDNNPDTPRRNPTRPACATASRIFLGPEDGSMFMSEYRAEHRGENSAASRRAANLGWNIWEGSFQVSSTGPRSRRAAVDVKDPRSDPEGAPYPLVEFGKLDPLFPAGNSAMIGRLRLSRQPAGPASWDRPVAVFGANPSGEHFST